MPAGHRCHAGLENAQAGEQFCRHWLEDLFVDECWVNTSEGWLYGELVALVDASPVI